MENKNYSVSSKSQNQDKIHKNNDNMVQNIMDPNLTAPNLLNN